MAPRPKGRRARPEADTGSRRRAAHDELAALWRDLLAGRWSLVDLYDLDGRRCVLARKNDAEGSGGRALTPRERGVISRLAAGHSQKAIASDLGVSPATFSELARRALAKIGLRSRAELVVFVCTGGSGR